MIHSRDISLQRLFYAIVFALLVLLFVNSQIFYLSDSEIWGAISPLWNGRLFEPSRFAFNLLNRLIMNCFSNRMEGLLALRATYFCFSAYSVFLLYKIGLHLFTKNQTKILLLAALSHPFYISHAFKIRADALSLFTFLVLVFLSIKFLKSKTTNTLSSSGFNFSGFNFSSLNFLVPALLLLTSLKSVYFVVAEVISLAITRKFNKNPSSPFRALFKGRMIGLTLLFLCYLSFPQLRHSAHSAWQFFISIFNGDPKSPDYLSPTAFQYLAKWTLISPLFVMLLIFGILNFIKTVRASQPKILDIEQYVLQISMAAVLILLLHNHRLPFFIAQYAFLASLLVVTGIRFLSSVSQRLGTLAAFALIISQLASSTYYSVRQWRLNNNTQQIRFYNSWRQTLLQSPDTAVLDPIALFTPTTQDPIFIGPGLGDQTSDLKNYILKYKPTYIFSSSRVEWYLPQLKEDMSRYEINTHSMVWRPKIEVLNPSDGVKLQDLNEILSGFHLSKELEKTIFLSLWNRKNANPDTQVQYWSFDHEPLKLKASTPIQLLKYLESIEVPPQSEIDITYEFAHETSAGSYRELFNFDYMW